jgi:uncharacterized metal-binding protein YceD (DUF177 family)
MMPGLFIIPIGGIRSGHHVFEFEIYKPFFDQFEESEIKDGSLTAVVEVEGGISHAEVEIMISGTVRICCDRCLEMFDYPLKCVNRLLVKYGNVRDNGDPDVIIIADDENELDLKQYIYEYIHLNLPIQRIHPDDADGISMCDPVMIQKLKEHLVDKEKITDTRWDELKKFTNDN